MLDESTTLVVDPHCREVPVQPKTVAPRFVTTPHGGVRWECEPLLCGGDLSGQPRQVSCWHYAHARLGSKGFGEPNLPLLNAQFKREIQYLRGLGRRSGILAIASRCGHLYAPFSSSGRLGLKELTNSDSFCPLSPFIVVYWARSFRWSAGRGTGGIKEGSSLRARDGATHSEEPTGCLVRYSAMSPGRTRFGKLRRALRGLG